jgi:UDP-N-acetylglucosamine diphosphorylase/glucosamine-1-phosphate N-acetyltransferase
MKMNICLFEDIGYKNLLPLVYLRPVYDLNCGILSLREKVGKYFHKANINLHSRDYLQDVMVERYPLSNNKFSDSEEIIYINGRLVINRDLCKQISKLNVGEGLTLNNEVVAVKLIKKDAKRFYLTENDLLDFNSGNFHKKEVKDSKIINYPWDLVNINGEEIRNDFELLRNKTNVNVKLTSHIVLINRKSIFIDKRTVINPFVVLDASEGPIYIGKNVEIFPHVTIKGPVYIGDNSLVKSNSYIYHNTSIGKVCKVGGEIENSIIHSYSNKQHEGFLGHSYLGSWINIGASTNNSDLKNNYSEVDVYVNGKMVNSGSKFVGLIMGDHSKTAINTMFNTGTNVGVSCNLFGSGFPPKYIPSFSWGGSEWLRTYDITKCVEVAKIVMQRRNIILTEKEELLLHKIYDLTSTERRN